MNHAQHDGYAISTRTGGALERKITQALALLHAVPLGRRDDHWAATIGGVIHARNLLNEGRRAKAGKVFASARALVEEVA